MPKDNKITTGQLTFCVAPTSHLLTRNKNRNTNKIAVKSIYGKHKWEVKKPKWGSTFGNFTRKQICNEPRGITMDNQVDEPY